MHYEVLAAHSSAPEDFQAAFSVEINGSDCTNFIDEIIKLLNESNCRDCTYQVAYPPAKTVEQSPHSTQHTHCASVCGQASQEQICPWCNGDGVRPSKYNVFGWRACRVCGGSGKLHNA
jgi:Na+-translocating ferredoxin:NAD+ oxidoreductase RNF subunit RnfB